MGTKPKPSKGPEDEEQQPWKPDDPEVNPERQERLKEMMEVSMKTVESSTFYELFIKQLKSPEIAERFGRVLGTETQFQMVIYGIGSIESRDVSRIQLSIAVLMKRDFDWVDNNVQVFDPVLSATECSVIETLGCTVLSVNEHACRVAVKPTLFFMPRCGVELYNNLLRTNWSIDRLSRIVLFGNSFQEYEETWSRISRYSPTSLRLIKPIMVAQNVTSEFALETTMVGDKRAFNCQSWHFFTVPGIDLELPMLVEEGSNIDADKNE